MLDAAVLALVALALAVIVAVVAQTRRRRIAADGPSTMPTPKGGLPFVGNLLQIDGARPHFTFTAWAAAVGDVYAVQLGPGRRMVVVSGEEAIREALVERGRALAGRPHPFRAGCITNNYRNIGFGDPCASWRRQKQLVHRDLKSYGDGLRRLEDVTSTIIERTVDEVLTESFVAAGGGGGRRMAVDFRPYLYAATLNIICTFLTGGGGDDDGDGYAKTDPEFQLFQKMERLGVTLIASAGAGAELDAFPWLRYFGNATWRRCVEFMELRDLLYLRMRERVVAAREAAAVVDPLTDERTTAAAGVGGLIGTLLAAVEEDRARSLPESDAVTEENIKGTFVDIILGGTASTTNLVYALLNILLHNPDVYAKLKREIEDQQKAATTTTATTKDGGGESEGRRLTVADRDAMPYTQAAILELLRFVSIAPFTVPHLALSDTSVGGYRVARGTEVLCNLWSLHHDERYWSRPWDFLPERFLTADGLAVLPPVDPARRRLMPFGAGPRRCTGEAFALNRLFVVAATLLQNCDVLPPEPENGISDGDAPELVSCDPRTYALGIAFYPMDFRVRLLPTKYCLERQHLAAQQRLHQQQLHQ